MRASLMLLIGLVLAGCGYDGWNKPGAWTVPPAGFDSNDSNLRVMLANPRDLSAGQGEETSDGALAARPVQLLLSGQRRPLPSVNASTVGATQVQPGMMTGGAGASTQQ